MYLNQLRSNPYWIAYIEKQATLYRHLSRKLDNDKTLVDKPAEILAIQKVRKNILIALKIHKGVSNILTETAD